MKQKQMIAKYRYSKKRDMLVMRWRMKKVKGSVHIDPHNADTKFKPAKEKP